MNTAFIGVISVIGGGSANIGSPVSKVGHDGFDDLKTCVKILTVKSSTRL